MTTSKKNVAVLFGGKSPEHEISIITGVQVLNNLDTTKYNPLPIYVSKNGTWYYSQYFNKIDIFKNLDHIPYQSIEVYLAATPEDIAILGTRRGIFGGQPRLDVDIFFPCFHGSVGENGGFQGLFDISEKPFVGSETLGSAVCMDKVLTKDVLRANNIPNSRYLQFSRAQIIQDLTVVVSQLEKEFKYPMFVKPAVGGSSVGITKATSQDALKNGLELAAAFDIKVIVEEGIENAREINVSVMGNFGEDLKVSKCEEVFHKGEFLTYDDKYKSDGGKSNGMASTTRKLPADLSDEMTLLVQETAKKTFSVLNCFGLARIDFLVKPETKEVFVIEVNTIPGSMAFYLWEATGMPFKEMVSNLIELALRRHEDKAKNITSFSTNVLQSFSGNLKSPKLG
jgi:D-alanine-D-alanine ligase